MRHQLLDVGTRLEHDHDKSLWGHARGGVGLKAPRADELTWSAYSPPSKSSTAQASTHLQYLNLDFFRRHAQIRHDNQIGNSSSSGTVACAITGNGLRLPWAIRRARLRPRVLDDIGLPFYNTPITLAYHRVLINVEAVSSLVIVDENRVREISRRLA